jgi:hypothetical protein
MEHRFAGDTIRVGGLERFAGEDMVLREVNVPGRIIEKAVLIPRRRLEIPDVTHHEK